MSHDSLPGHRDSPRGFAGSGALHLISTKLYWARHKCSSCVTIIPRRSETGRTEDCHPRYISRVGLSSVSSGAPELVQLQLCQDFSCTVPLCVTSPLSSKYSTRVPIHVYAVTKVCRETAREDARRRNAFRIPRIVPSGTLTRCVAGPGGGPSGPTAHRESLATRHCLSAWGIRRQPATQHLL